MKFEIPANDYKKMRDEHTPHLLLDVRQDWEVKKAHIPGSKHIALPDLMDKVDQLDKKQTIVVYCHHGVRSMNACLFLRELGFQDVLSLSGGIEAWSTQVDSAVPRY
jgi:rhodanese-related sulfurtransferase